MSKPISLIHDCAQSLLIIHTYFALYFVVVVQRKNKIHVIEEWTWEMVFVSEFRVGWIPKSDYNFEGYRLFNGKKKNPVNFQNFLDVHISYSFFPQQQQSTIQNMMQPKHNIPAIMYDDVIIQNAK
jgi:hypothetical protein